jgi:hypothetical protein
MVTSIFSDLTPTNVNYNFSDIMSGTTVVPFYFGRTNSSYYMTNFKWCSETDSPLGFGVSPTGDKSTYAISSLVFNRPTQIGGYAIINLSLRLSGGTADSATFHPHYKLERYNATEGTVSIVAYEGDVSVGMSSSITEYVCAHLMSIPTTTLKVGDFLILSFYFNVTDAGAGTVYPSFDPLGVITTGFTVLPSTSVMYIPMRLDI